MGQRALFGVPCALLGALFLTACDPSAPLDSYALTGRITVRLDDGEEEGVAGATVTFASDTRLVEQTTADDSGRYRMWIATDHAFGQVRAEAEGFAPAEETVYFDTVERRVDLSLRALE
jgi:hypothetical protein